MTKVNAANLTTFGEVQRIFGRSFVAGNLPPKVLKAHVSYVTSCDDVRATAGFGLAC